MIESIRALLDALAVSFDLPILDWIAANLWCPVLDAVMPVITVLGDAGIFWIAVAVLFIFTKKYRKIGIGMMIALMMGLVVCNICLKPMIARIRPYDLNPLVTLIVDAPHDFSFPSGHTAVSFAFAAAAACMGKKAHTLSLAFACLMGVSRMYLYVHYPTDVLAGAFFGTLCGLLALFLWKKIIGRDKI